MNCSFNLKSLTRLHEERWAGACSTNEEKDNRKHSVGKHEQKISHGGYGLRWGDNIKMIIIGTECEGVDWIHLGQNRVQRWIFPEDGNEPACCTQAENICPAE